MTPWCLSTSVNGLLFIRYLYKSFLISSIQVASSQERRKNRWLMIAYLIVSNQSFKNIISEFFASSDTTQVQSTYKLKHCHMYYPSHGSFVTVLSIKWYRKLAACHFEWETFIIILTKNMSKLPFYDWWSSDPWFN